MISKKYNYNTATFYTSAICNLNCRYCQIDKNPALVKIDKMLEESFKDPDYYFQKIKKYFPLKTSLTKIETWGGEPFLAMDRIYPLLHKIIDYYPYFDSMFSSTNFSFPQWIDQMLGLIHQFVKYPYRTFKLTIQLSVDGPPYINDANRGNGISEKCLNNFKKLLSILKTDLPDNVLISFAIKQTLDLKSLITLDTKDKIVDYYKFFQETYIAPVKELNNPNIAIFCEAPNFATPIPATQADGIKFSEFIQNCIAVEKESKEEYFPDLLGVVPYTDGVLNKALTYNYPFFTCGSGTTSIGFLPNNIISTCNEGFTQIIGEYKQQTAKNIAHTNKTISFNKFIDELKSPLCYPEEQYPIYENFMEYYNDQNTVFRLINLTSQIMTLAMADQIDTKYLDEQEAQKAAVMIQNQTPYCVKDNFQTCSCISLQSLGLLRFLLNGALDQIIDYCGGDDFFVPGRE